MCSICGKRFFSKTALKKHVETQHNKKVAKIETLFKCEHCSMSYPHKFSLVKHLESAHDIAPKRNHTCEECGKNFSTPTSLRTHIKKGTFFYYFWHVS